MTFLHLHVLLKKEKKSSLSNAKNVNLQHCFISLQDTARTRLRQVIAGRQANLRQRALGLLKLLMKVLG